MITVSVSGVSVITVSVSGVSVITVSVSGVSVVTVSVSALIRGRHISVHSLCVCGHSHRPSDTATLTPSDTGTHCLTQLHIV